MPMASGPAEIAIVGWYGHGNFGDDLLMQLVAEVVADMAPGRSEVVLTGDSPASLNVAAGLDMPFRVGVGSAEYPAVVLGGGGLFFDARSPGRHRIPPWVGRPAATRAIRRSGSSGRYLTGIGRRRFAIGIGLGPFPKHSTREWTSVVELETCERVWVRDQSSARWLTLRGLDSAKVRLGADLSLLKPLAVSGTGPDLLIIVRDSMHRNDGRDKWVPWLAALAAMAKQRSLSVEFLALASDSDAQVVDALSSRGISTLTYDGKNINEVAWAPARYLLGGMAGSAGY
jgi:hypothetical protein